MAERLCVITLVHGTFAPNAAWTQTDSKICRALDHGLETPVIERFNWSAQNSARSRKRAAEDLARHLKSLISLYPDANHFIIGHSHGGSVALYAIKNAAFHKHIKGVVCLSTPFLVTKRRSNIFWNFNTTLGESILFQASYAMCFATLLMLLFCAAWTFSKYFIGLHINAMNLLPFLLLLFAAILIIHWVSLPLSSRVKKSLLRVADGLVNAATLIEKDLDLDGFNPADILIVRSLGDEASSFIGMSHLLSWFVTRIWSESERLGSRLAGGVVEAAFPAFVRKDFPRTLTGLVSLYLQTSGLALFLLLGSFWGRELLKSPIMRWPTIVLIAGGGLSYASCQVILGGLIILYLLFFSLGPIGVLVLTLLSLVPFGWDLARRSILLSVSAESTPKGKWELALIEPPL